MADDCGSSLGKPNAIQNNHEIAGTMVIDFKNLAIKLD